MLNNFYDADQPEEGERTAKRIEGIYILHFNKPVIYEKIKLFGDAQHYVGQTTDVESRWQQHLTGEGADMVKRALEQGIKITPAAMFPIGSGEELRKYEGMITRYGPAKLCPCCVLKNNPDLERKPKKDVFRSRYNFTCIQCNAERLAGTLAQKTDDGPRCYSHIEAT